MIHSLELIEQIEKLPQTSYDGDVFRTTGLKSDPTASSPSGGRWAIPEHKPGGFSILYTSTERNGAIAEVASYLGLLTPIPQKTLRVHTINVSVKKALRLAIGDLRSVGIDPSRYTERDYEQTQLVGAAMNFLGFDGLLAPSARWACDNLMIFSNNHSIDEQLTVSSFEDVQYDEWREFADSVSSAFEDQ